MRRAPNARSIEIVAPRLPGPGLRQAAEQSEQHRPAREPHQTLSLAGHATTAVDHEVGRGKNAFHLRERQRPRFACADEARGRQAQRARRVLDLRAQRRDAGTRRRFAGPGQGHLRRRGPSPAQRDLEGDQGGDGREPRGPGIERERGARALRLVDPSEQQEAPDLEQARVGRVVAIAVGGERSQRLGQRPRRPGQIARCQRNLRLGRQAARPLERLARSEAPRRPPQQRARACHLPELGHRDPAQREGGRIVPQRDPLERAQRIARAQGASGRGDRRVHDPILKSVPGVECRVSVDDSCAQR